MKAFTLGREQGLQGKFLDAIAFYKRAIELDSNFAVAYSNLGIAYSNLGEENLVAEYTRKAFELRDRVSEREKFSISSRYYDAVSGELDKASEVLEVWKRSYPRDPVPRNNLGLTYERLGDFERAAEEYRADISLDPQPDVSYQNLVRALLYIDRRDEAKAISQELIAKKIDHIYLHFWLYELAFSERDAGGMQREAEWAAGKPNEYGMLWGQSAAALSEGKLESASELVHRANDLALRQNLKGWAAYATGWLTARAALAGKCRSMPIEMATEAVRPSPWLIGGATLAVAFCGSATQANSLIEDERKRFPTDTLVNAIDLPTARAAVEINRGSPTRAIELLQSATPYERRYPIAIYMRGLAYLRAHKGQEAATEFQKIAGPRGAFPSWPEHVLAYLGMARAYALLGNIVKSRKAYEDFLALSKDADLDIPVLKQAKAEYAKLK